MSAHGLLLADEVFRALRHGLLNRFTGMGAVGFQLRRKLEHRGGPVADDEAIAALFSSLSRQIGMASESLNRRLVPPPVRPAGPCDLSRMVEGLVTTLTPQNRVSLDRTGPHLHADIDDKEVAVATLCLIQNAVEAIDGVEHGHIEVRCRPRDEHLVAIEVLDTGPGLTPAVTEEAFERFFTTKPGHVGLGLNVAAGVASRWNGRVEIANRDDGPSGAVAVLTLPSSH